MLEPITKDEWVRGDYRYAAMLDPAKFSLKAMANRYGAEVTTFVEEGLGQGHAIGLRSSQGVQVGLEQYDHGKGLNILLRFEDDACSRSELTEVLAELQVNPEDVQWFSPHLSDA